MSTLSLARQRTIRVLDVEFVVNTRNAEAGELGSRS
jgi:hypothetical protein